MNGGGRWVSEICRWMGIMHSGAHSAAQMFWGGHITSIVMSPKPLYSSPKTNKPPDELPTKTVSLHIMTGVELEVMKTKERLINLTCVRRLWGEEHYSALEEKEAVSYLGIYGCEEKVRPP